MRFKQLWMVEDVFRSIKSLLDTRPIIHWCDETTRGHVFCSFLALPLRKELKDGLARKEGKLEWGAHTEGTPVANLQKPVTHRGV